MSNKPQQSEYHPVKDSTHARKSAKSKYIFNYGRALEPKLANPSLAGYYRPWRFTDQRYSGLSKIFYSRARDFRVSLDIGQFAYENVSVKVIGGQLIIEGYHDTVADQLGKVRRRFTRKYKMPPDVEGGSLYGKYKKGFLFLWGQKSPADVEKSDAARVDDKIKTDRIASSAKTGRIRSKSHQLARDDAKPLIDGRSDKHAAAQFQKSERRSRNDQITITIAYSPGSPD